MTPNAMSQQPSIPLRIVLINAALVLVWLPLILLARTLIESVIAVDPSDDLLLGARLAVIGTLVIITATWLFGIVLINKFLSQNLGDGAQRRIVRPVLLVAIVLYVAAGVVAFGTHP
jgi:hypothetical protein